MLLSQNKITAPTFGEVAIKLKVQENNSSAHTVLQVCLGTNTENHTKTEMLDTENRTV